VYFPPSIKAIEPAHFIIDGEISFFYVI